MAQTASDEARDHARDLLERNIRKTVSISTLRRIRGIVDDYDEERRLNDRLSRRILIAGIVVTSCLAVILLLTTGGALPRLITAVLGWFK